MSDWIVRQWSDVGACWLQCPNCLTTTRFDHLDLIKLYSPEPDKHNPNPRPHAKCEACDFTPYLPLELKRQTDLDVVIAGPGTIWASVNQATTRVIAETYIAPERIGRWHNLKPSSADE